MASLLRVPEVAAGATEATLAEWLVEENSAFTAEQAVVVIETDKAMVEVPAGAAAVLLRHLVPGGTLVEVGAAIALVGAESERNADFDELLAGLGITTAGSDATTTADAAVVAVAPMASVHAAPEPETAREPDVVNGAGLADEATGRARVFASPIARRMLRDAGLSSDDVEGTGPDGRIRRCDVEAAIDRAKAASALVVASSVVGRSQRPPATLSSTSSPSPATPATPATAPVAVGYTDRPHTRMRRAIAGRLTASKQTIPHFYLKRAVRLDPLLELRVELNAVSPQKISVNDLIVKAVGVTHTEVPDANAIWTEDAVRVFDADVDVAVAIASARGLVTPVVRGVADKAPSAIARQVRAYVQAADAGSLAQRDLEGGSITVTNLGMYGVEEFAAIINPPHSAILAVGAGTKTPIVLDDVVQVATVMTLVLSVDHRVIDGAMAAQWMESLVRTLESPLRLLT